MKYIFLSFVLDAIWVQVKYMVKGRNQFEHAFELPLFLVRLGAGPIYVGGNRGHYTYDPYRSGSSTDICLFMNEKNHPDGRTKVPLSVWSCR